MSEIAVKEQEELNGKLAEMEERLEEAEAAGETNAAGFALEQKKKIDAIQAESDSKLKKVEAKLEKVQKQLEDMKAQSGD